MKKKIFLIIAILLFTPLFVYADCTKEEIQEYKNAIKNIDYDIDFKKGNSEEDEPAHYYKVKISNIPTNIFVEFKGNNNIYAYYELTNYLIIDTGGVFEVNTFNSKCSDDSLNKFTIYLPEVNSSGSQENNVKNSTMKTNNTKSIILLLIIGIIISIILILIFMKKQKRRS